MRKRHKMGIGMLAVMFAVGLVVSCFFPPKLLIAVLAIWVIILGFSCSKC